MGGAYMLLLIMRLFSAWHIPHAFSYVSSRMIMAALLSLVLSVVLGPQLIKMLYSLRIGQKVSRLEDVPALKDLHGKKKDTPTMGGVLILGSMLISNLLFMDFTKFQTGVLAVLTVALGIVGGVDDAMKLKSVNSKGMSSKMKFLLQSGIALFLSYVFYDMQPVVATTYFIPFVKYPFMLSGTIGMLVFMFISSFVIVGTSNAVNLTDGLDGLATGLIVMTGGVLGVFAFLSNNAYIASYLNIMYIEGAGEVAVYMAALFGAGLGFLWYNGHPAQLFMGDVGSVALGGILGMSAVLLRRELVLAVAGGVFVVETLSVILQVLSYRYRNKKRVFLCAPLHHHFEHKGWPETKVVARFWLVGLLLALFAISSIKFQ